ncbi:terminase [Mesorhizobium sp. LNHC209A00]|nr:terminase [Mesorhizobium sp. LNHC209A00]
MAMDMTELIKELYRSHFPSFTGFVYRELHNDQWLANWHIDVMADELAGIAKGEHGRLILNAPPRSLKSFCGSIALPAFLLGNDPKKQILIVVGNPGLGIELLAKLRRLMSSSRYRGIFPHVRFDQTASGIVLPQGGAIRFATIGHQFSGRGADLIIVDDPLSPSHAKNEKRRASVNKFYNSDVATRLNSKGGAILVIMQRVHPKDLTAHILANQPDFKQLVLSAIAREDETWKLSNGKVIRRAKFQALHPERESWQQLLDTLRQIGSFQFCGQYLQGGAYFTERESECDFFWEVRGSGPGSKPYQEICGLIIIRYVDCIVHRIFGVAYDGPKMSRAMPEQSEEDEDYGIEYQAALSKSHLIPMPEKFRFPERKYPKYFII